MIVGMAGETTSCSIAVTIIATMSAAVTIRRPGIHGPAAPSLCPTDCPSPPASAIFPTPCVNPGHFQNPQHCTAQANPDTGTVPGARILREGQDRHHRAGAASVFPGLSHTGCVKAPLQATSQAS